MHQGPLSYPDVATAVNELKALKKRRELSARNAKVLEQTIRSCDRAIGDLERFADNKVKSLTMATVSPALRRDAQSQLTTAVASTMLSITQMQAILGDLSASATGAVSNAVNWFLNRIINVISSVGQHLNVQSWTIGVSGGFPWGVNFQLSVTFGP